MRDYETFDCSIFQIRLFLTVAEEQSFSRAAAKMNVEQPTLSRRISTLEEALGVTLFKRDARPVNLTPEGELLYKHWKPLMAQMDHAIEVLWNNKKKRLGRLVVCSVDSSNLNNGMLEVNRQMVEHYPELSLTYGYVLLSRWHDKMLQGDLDMVLTAEFEARYLDSRFTHETVAAFPKLICMLRTNPLSRRDALSAEELSKQEFIVIDEAETPEYLRFIREICHRLGFEPKIGKTIANAHGFISSLQKPNEVFICDRLLCGYDYPEFKTFPIAGVRSGLSVIWHKDNTNPYIQPYVQLLKNHFKAWNEPGYSEIE